MHGSGLSWEEDAWSPLGQMTLFCFPSAIWILSILVAGHLAYPRPGQEDGETQKGRVHTKEPFFSCATMAEYSLKRDER